MLKTRVMPTMLYKGYGLVKGKAFDSWRRTGSVMQTVKVYDMRGVDELVLLDIAATDEGREPDFALVDECFMPLTVGGGIKTIEHVRGLLKVGADKVAINTATVESPSLVAETARKFGAQCVVASIDFRGREVFTHSGKKATGLDVVAHAKACERLGAGEILLTSVERDGCMSGYDLEVTAAVSAAVNIPVIASGGAGSYEDMARAVLEGKASAVAAAAVFHFTEQTPREAKLHLASRGVPVRL
jgi:imidazole glycerol-phosphate synthase subunit HisF